MRRTLLFRPSRLSLRRYAVVAVILGTAVFLGLLGPASTSALGQEGWVIERFHAEIQIRSDASLAVVETIDVDFGSLDRHGIFREIPVRYLADEDHDRVYRLTVRSVLDGSGRSLPYEVSARGANRVIRIGDPDRTVSGKQTYRIVYEVQGALNAFASHDELFWNVNGEWPAPLGEVSARVAVDGALVEHAECFEGGVGSTAPCRVTREGDRTIYRATRALGGSEQLTVVAALPKGAVTEPAPIIERARRDVDDLFELGPLTVGSASVILLAVLGGLTGRWATSGRDRRYLKRYYLDPTSREELAGPLDRDVIVTEYEPPELLRPAEIGLLLDERADPKDLTATIVHLAVRGYLAIEEVPATHGSGTADRILRRRASLPDDRLAGYEKRILDGLFEEGPEVKLSDLKGTFHGTLHEAQKDLYRDAVRRRWFGSDPYWTRIRWQVAGFAVALAGVALTFVLAFTLGWGIVGAALVLGGLSFFAFSGAMPSRTAQGRELLLRILGFRRYMETAETERQRFAERENIFSEYLPYAIVFGSVTKWAKAFAGIDVQRATAGWYSGASVASVGSFTSELSSMSSAVSSAISATPASSRRPAMPASEGEAGVPTAAKAAVSPTPITRPVVITVVDPMNRCGCERM